jgi:hypothetical protein
MIRGRLMNNIDTLLSRVHKLKKMGDSKWLACCPAHDDKSPSLAIKLADDRILIHCFAGCDVSAIVGALGLELSDLMPESKRNSRPDNKRPKFNKYELFDRIVEESAILIVAIRQMFKGTPLNDGDMERVVRAEGIIDDIIQEVRR